MNRKLLIGLSILSLLIPSVGFAFSKVEISDGSVKALYHLENLTDATGNAQNNLADAGSPGVTFSSGLFNNSANFGDTWQNGNFLTTSSAAGISLATSSAFSIWLFPTSTGANSVRPFLWYSNVGANKQVQVTYAPGQATLKLDIEWGIGDHFTNTTITQHQWSNLFVTSDQNDLVRVYFNGTQIDQFTKGGVNTTGPQIGIGNSAAKTIGWPGLIDDVALFNKDIPTSTIVSVWNGGAGAEICLTAGCAGAVATTTTACHIRGKGTCH